MADLHTAQTLLNTWTENKDARPHLHGPCSACASLHARRARRAPDAHERVAWRVVALTGPDRAHTHPHTDRGRGRREAAAAAARVSRLTRRSVAVLHSSSSSKGGRSSSTTSPSSNSSSGSSSSPSAPGAYSSAW